MPNLKDIRSRIDTVKNTSQITRAMKMVSAAKLRRAQLQIVNMRPYAKTLLQMIADIAVTQRVTHPLMLQHPEVKKVLLVVLTSDRGLCGAFNTNINKFAETYYRDNQKKFEAVDFLFIGRRGADYFGRRQIKAKDVILKLDKDVSYALATKVAGRLMKQYLE
ncbi:MAG: F0F1 ATP synthase subunit gamma, partial [Pseudobdellovibrionaceae bacterium]